MKKFTKVIDLLKNNFWSLVEFEIIFKLLSVLIFTPLFLHFFDLIMHISGFDYLTLENILIFFTKPLTVIMLIILIIFMTFYTMFDITTLIIILDASYQKKKIKFTEATSIALNKCKRVFKIKNILIAFLVLFLIPFLNIGLMPSYITSIRIPEFVIEFIWKRKELFCLFILLMIILINILLRWLYSLHYFILEDLDFREARKKSINLSQGNHLKDIFTLFIIQIGIFLLYLLFLVIGILLIIGLNKLFSNIILLKSITTTIIWVFIAISFAVFTLLIVPVSYAGISVMYYFHKKAKKEKIKFIRFNETTKVSFRLKKVFVLFSVFACGGGCIFTYGLYKGKYNLNIEYVRDMEVTAHRGSSIKYPENTMRAFREAKKEGADWIELDVQETKDGKIIVLHDKNLKRITGIDKKIWKASYEEIKDFDVGSFLNEEFKDERIPLLEEVIRWAKNNNMKLNIELKPSGHEKDLEKLVIEIIKDMDFTKDCVLASQKYEVLENIKNYDKNIKTAYVMSIAYGDLLSFKAADQFSIEASSINENLVKMLHREGKHLYAWTINSEDGIKKMLDLKVDNIVTDDVVLAKKIIYTSKTSNLINEYIRLVENLFQ